MTIVRGLKIHQAQNEKSKAQVKSDTEWVATIINHLARSGSCTSDKQWQVRFFEFSKNKQENEIVDKNARVDLANDKINISKNEAKLTRNHTSDRVQELK